MSEQVRVQYHWTNEKMRKMCVWPWMNGGMWSIDDAAVKSGFSQPPVSTAHSRTE
jgi:hypothetical protein